jgi:hypothetical protein
MWADPLHPTAHDQDVLSAAQLAMGDLNELPAAEQAWLIAFGQGPAERYRYTSARGAMRRKTSRMSAALMKATISDLSQ